MKQTKHEVRQSTEVTPPTHLGASCGPGAPGIGWLAGPAHTPDPSTLRLPLSLRVLRVFTFSGLATVTEPTCGD